MAKVYHLKFGGSDHFYDGGEANGHGGFDGCGDGSGHGFGDGGYDGRGRGDGIRLFNWV